MQGSFAESHIDSSNLEEMSCNESPFDNEVAQLASSEKVTVR